MNRIVQITGLPRSGTAFMAAFSMLHPAANVFHENIADGGDWRGRLKDSVRDFPLTVDCGTYQYFPGAVFPGSNKLFLARDWRESAKAAAAAAGRSITQDDIRGSAWLFNEADKWVEANKVPVALYSKLFREDILAGIWRWMDPQGVPFPQSKVRQLIRMRIVRKDVETFSMENVKKNAHELLKPWD